ncbi:sigma-54-dependent transcriptional regulator [Halodesulfovibrio marinisediminis]|uniref:Two-component system, NtrC family, response regulator n=1 Tax=Halodesulfovibrio marinisediminis DSM 17456 TaxID=1121457 RepID=A0A1N6IIT3_9BACT|nr:sigma-54 dependent transcriptional regulator [Halodesulfovibrio marinisediminis]SIO31889.1 two-component system, NtrC family, response regulator [Halodesulfovibrio marinisediminis DSM 17456]
MFRILIIDDDPNISNIISQLAEDSGFESSIASNLTDGIATLEKKSFDLVFLDVRLPDGSGISALPRIRSSKGQPDVIIITGAGDPDGAELAIQNGAWDYIEKGSSLKQITFSMERALKFRERNKEWSERIIKRDSLIGDSPALQSVLENISVAATGDASVLITGETGTGKEVVARTVHENSSRAEGPFVVLDCASIPENLVEGELFGHIKGSFTGATTTQKGVIEQADGGTLFLDEVGELPLPTQSAFLRVLQEKRYRPIGSTSEKTSNFRLVAATNRNLEKMCEEGTFRTDLYYRLKSCSMEIPPLRNRLEDVPALTKFHTKRLCAKYSTSTKRLSKELITTLMHYEWPGNVRELVQTLERIIMRAKGESTLYPEHLPVDIRARAAGKMLRPIGEETPLAEQNDSSILTPVPAEALSSLFSGEFPSFKLFRTTCIAQIEKVYLENLIRQANGSIKEACKLSGLSRTRLYVLMKEHDISR